MVGVGVDVMENRVFGETTDRYGLKRVRLEVGVLVARVLVVCGGSVVDVVADVVLDANAGWSRVLGR